MNSYFLIVKYVFEKNNVDLTDSSLDEFFSNGNSFPKFVSILFGLENIPGIVDAKNTYQILNNNKIALSYMGQKNPFFKSYTPDLNKDQVPLIQLIMNKIYFKINRASFIKKCNDFINTRGSKITNFSEFVQGNGFMKLLNVVSNGSIPSEINSSDDLIDTLTKYMNSLNIFVIIDESSLMQSNYDILMYQGLIIMESNTNIKNEQPSNNNVTELKHQQNNEIKNQNKPSEKLNDNVQNISVKDDNTIQEKEVPKPSLDKKPTSDGISISFEQNDDKIKLDEEISYQSSEIFNDVKSSYLNIVNNIMENNHKTGIIFLTDFEDGEILPQLTESLLKEKVPNVVENPEGYDKMMNNMSSLYFINRKFPDINPRNYLLTKEDDIINLIRVLLKKVILTKECIMKMKEEIDRIFSQYKIVINNFNVDWKNGNNFVLLLNFVTKGQIPCSIPNLDMFALKDLFVKSNCISIIEDDSLFENLDEIVIMYQIKIILDEIDKRKIILPEKSVINSQEKTEKFNDQKEIYDNNSCPILRLLNLIGSNIGLHYEKLDDIFNGMTLFRLVQYLMKIDNIPGIKNEAKYELDNFNAVIDYLSQKSKVFRYSLLDYKQKTDINIIWFATTLLDEFYLKESKIQLIKKAGEILGENIVFNDIKKVFLYGNGFYKLFDPKGNFEKKNYYDQDSLLKCFQKENVPFILDDDSLTNVNNDYICFQLQLIFDKIAPIQKENKILKQTKINEEKFISRINFDDNIQDTMSDDQFGSFLFKLKQKKKSTDSTNLDNEKTESFKNDALEDFMKRLDITYNVPKQTNKNLLLPDSSELLSIKGNLKNKSSNIVPSDTKINIVVKPEKDAKGGEIDDYFKYDLYSYESPIKESEKLVNDANKKLEKFFKTTMAQITNEKTEKDVKFNRKYDATKVLKSYRLYNYSDNSWKFDKLALPAFMKDNNISSKDTLYCVLFPPSCTKDVEIINDPFYVLSKTISGCKTIEAKLCNDIYVEYIYIGNIKDIILCFNLQNLCTRFEKLAFIQLRYPPTFTNIKAIDNMQSALTLQANYIVSMFSSNINESIHFINTCVHQANNCFALSKNIGMTLLMKDLCVPLESKEMKELVADPKFEVHLDKLLNSESTIFKELKESFIYLMTTIQWIDINNYETYNNFLQKMIDFCQNNVNNQSVMNNIINLLPTFVLPDELKTNSVDKINNQKDMNNFMDNISKKVSEINNQSQGNQYNISILSNDINYYDHTENIVFNQKIWDSFFSNNDINAEKDSLSTVLIINSKKSDVSILERLFGHTTIYQTKEEEGLQVKLIYVDIIDNLKNEFNLKLKKSNKNHHLVFINIENFSNRSVDLISLQASIALRCDLIMTIANYDKFSSQVDGIIKLNNAFDCMSYIFKSIDQKSQKIFNSTFLIFDHINNINDEKNIRNKINEIPPNSKRLILNGYDFDSCSNALCQIIDSCLEKEGNSIKKYNEFFNDINNQIIKNEFVAIITKYIQKIVTKNEDKETTKYLIYSEIKAINELRNTLDVYLNGISLNEIYFEFMNVLQMFKDNSDITTCINNLRQKFVEYIIECYYEKEIDSIPNNFLSWQSFSNDAINFIKNSVTEIDKQFVQLLKNTCRQNICDNIYEFVEETFKKNKSDDLFINKIYQKVIEKFEVKINECLTEIDKYYNDTKTIIQEKKEATEEDISQESIKYVLAVKESVREISVEVTCDEDIEKEIPYDF